MSSSRGKNFRRRSDDNDGNREDKSTPTTTPNQTLTLTKPKNPKPKGAKLLSFVDDDEEEGPFAPRPTTRPTSSSSTGGISVHKISSSKDRSASHAPAPPIPSNVQPQKGEYTRERLRELQKNARSLGSISKPQLPSFSDEPKPQKSESPAEPVILLKGLVKPSPASVTGREKEKEKEKEKTLLQLREEEDEEREEEEDHEVDDMNDGRFAKLGIDGKATDSSVIPDQATINAIRAKRDRLRKSRGPAPDYISLDGGASAGRSSGGASSDEDEHDFQGRISLLGDTKDGEAKKGVFEGIDERVFAADARIVDGELGAVEDDEDEVERLWEQEQFRKGLGKRIDDASSHSGASVVLPAPTIQSQPPLYPGITHQSSSSFASLGPAYAITRSAEVMSISQQAEVAIRAMQENITKLKDTHSRTLTSLTRTDENLLESLSDITTLEKSLETAGKKFIFMQKLRDFISVMCDFLQAKAPFIEELEEQMQKLHEERASAIVERRAADDADEMNEVEAAIKAAMSVLSKGSGAAFISAATSAAQAASAAARESSNLPVQLDEFGRDVNLQKRMDLTRRADDRKRRKGRSESKRMSSVGKENAYQHIEGESSTDESDSESSAYQSSRDELLQTAGQIFSDAAEEYSELSVVKGWFERWKKQYSSTYRDAYMSLSAPTVFSPYVRLELLKWDPLYEDSDFCDMKWHNLLFDYGLPENATEFHLDDADANLIPELVERVALPILHHEIAHCWDILSTRRTENAVFATNLIITYIPASSEALQELLSVVRTRLAEAVANLIVPTWSLTVTKVVPGAAQIAAYRFGVSVRLLRNICLWKDILALPALEKLALDELLGGKVLPHVRSIMSNIHDAIPRTERIVASLSGVWSGPNVTRECNQKLQPLVDCLAELGRKLEKRHASGVNEEETLGLAHRLKRMLVELNEYDRARAILRTFQLKEAL